MATRTRHDLINELHREALRSTRKALEESAKWNSRTARLSAESGGDRALLRIRKRDDQELADALKAHAWHRDHASFCVTIINMLMNEEIRRVVSEPA